MALKIYIPDRNQNYRRVFRNEAPEELVNMFNSMGLTGFYWWTFENDDAVEFLENTLNLLNIEYEYTDLEYEDFVDKFRKIHQDRLRQ
jgi:hypothetical protein